MNKNEYLITEHPKRTPTHPGVILREDTMPNLGLSITAASKELGIYRQTLHRILNGSYPITPSMALRLGKFFNTSPALWLSMQETFDLRQAEIELSEELKRIPVHPTHQHSMH